MWVERELLGLSPYGFLIRGSVDLTLSHQATQGGSINWLWRIVMDLHFTMPSWTSMKSEKHISLVQILTLETQHTSSTSSSFDYLHDLSWLPPYSQFHPMFFFVFLFFSGITASHSGCPYLSFIPFLACPVVGLYCCCGC